jgi:PTS system nitrogen regulatory IIA component
MAEVDESSFFDSRRIFIDLPGGDVGSVLAEISRRLEASGDVRDAEDLVRRLMEREKLGCTALGGGMSIPHTKVPGLDRPTVAIGVSRDGVDFHAFDGKPVRLIFLVLSPADSPAGHLQVLARISRLIKTPGVTEAILAADNAEQIREALSEADARLAGS